MPDIRFTLPAAVLLPPMLAAVAALVVAARRRRWDGRDLAWRLLLVGYLTALAAVTFFPFQVVIGRYAAHPSWLDTVQVVPLLMLDPQTFLLNVLMTVPLGVLVPVLDRRAGLGRVVLTGLAVSVGIELAQLAAGTLLDASRTADVDDVIANTIGALLGCLLFRALVHPVDRLGLLPMPALRYDARADRSVVRG